MWKASHQRRPAPARCAATSRSSRRKMAGDGHPVEIMDLTFAIQALCAHRLANEHASMENRVHLLPKEIDDEVARTKLDAIGMGVDTLTPEQEEFLAAWRE